MKKEKVLFNHDAAIDEFMAAVLLTTMKEVDVEVVQQLTEVNGFYQYVLQQFRR